MFCELCFKESSSVVLTTRDSICKIGNHPAAVMSNKFKVRIRFEDTAKDKPGHSSCRFIRPAKHAEDPVLGMVLASIIRYIDLPLWVNLYWQIMGGQFFIKRQEFFVV